MNMCILCENVTQFCLFINFEKKNFNNISGFFNHHYLFCLFCDCKVDKFSFFIVFSSLLSIALDQLTGSMSVATNIGSCKDISVCIGKLSIALLYSIFPITLIFFVF